MKSIIRHILVNLLGIYLASVVVTGLSWQGDIKILLLASVALGLINLIVRPVVKLITLPINMVTMGLFALVINALMLYLVTILVPAFTVGAFYFKGLDAGVLIVPAVNVGRLEAFIVAAGVISVISTFIGWVTDK